MPGLTVETTQDFIAITQTSSSKTTLHDALSAFSINHQAVLKSITGQESHPDSPLPTIAQCAAHLQLLDTFVILKTRVKQWGKSLESDPETVWQVFVKLACIRFNVWIRSMTPCNISTFVPPLDVLLVWHSFMLNPGSYLKFCKTNLRSLAPLAGLPWGNVHRAIDPTSGTLIIPPVDKANIESQGLHPCLLEFLKMDSSLNSTSLDDLHAKLVSSSGILSAGHDPSEIRRLCFASRVAENAKYIDAFTITSLTYSLGQQAFDPSAAVHRQSNFAENMFQFGWLQSPNLSSTLINAVSRYNNFFTLLSASPGAAVPTLDVDLVWHTHQLSPGNYIKFSKTMTGGRFVDHNDDVEDGEIQDDFRRIQALYRDQFGEEYLICHSWDCEAARLCQTRELSDAEHEAVGVLIAEERARRLKMGLPVEMTYASCICRDMFGDEKHGGHGHTSCNSECGSNCNGHCNSNCSTTCCGSCNMGCVSSF